MILGALLVIGVHSPRHLVVTSDTVSRLHSGLIRLDTQSSRFILRSGIPALDRTAGEDDPVRLFHYNWSELYWKMAANIRYTTPYEILKTQLPVLALTKPAIRPPTILPPYPAASEPEVDKTITPPVMSDKPVVFLYHTHTTESYIPESGRDHSRPEKGEKGDIVKVGAYMKRILEEKYGIKTVHCDKIHDSYPFRESYLRSQATIKEYLKTYPSIRYVFDIHRDATPGVKATCTIRGEKTSTIAVVVGTDRMGLEHPHWKENQQFAINLTEAMNRYYPGLSSGIIVSDARYNQHLHHRALILEFGDQNSRLEETYHAVDNFAAIFADHLKNDSDSE